MKRDRVIKRAKIERGRRAKVLTWPQIRKESLQRLIEYRAANEGVITPQDAKVVLARFYAAILTPPKWIIEIAEFEKNPRVT
ncbi:MAG: hypothetical protein COA62_15980 [Rhodobiaceae bacterium]|nr:MAG: hypothetical protein COA62_15980 [Rhodobiaceae bacterium]